MSFLRVTSLMGSLAAFGLIVLGCKSPTSEDNSLAELFSETGTEIQRIDHNPPGHRTFVIWVNGDSDHFVKSSTLGADGSVVRADAIEVSKLRAAATQCSDCNVILLHIQRGGERWYTSDNPWATYLRVFIRGKKVLERHVAFLNAADPKVVSSLLQFSENHFGNNEIHFIYRGHSFFPTYDPKTSAQTGIRPFAFSFPESPYGIHEFTLGLSDAHLKRPLASITLAACSMARLEIASALSPYANTLIAPETDVLETTNVSFGFSFLAQDPDDEAETAGFIAENIMSPFQQTQQIVDAMMEYSISKIDLSWASDFKSRIDTLLELNATGIPAAIRTAHVEKLVSDRYLAELKAQGKTQAEIDSFASFVRIPAISPSQTDLVEFLSQIPGSESKAMILEVSQHVQVYNPASAGHQSGISFDANSK